MNRNAFISIASILISLMFLQTTFAKEGFTAICSLSNIIAPNSGALPLPLEKAPEWLKTLQFVVDDEYKSASLVVTSCPTEKSLPAQCYMSTEVLGALICNSVHPIWNFEFIHYFTKDMYLVLHTSQIVAQIPMKLDFIYECKE